MLKLSFRETMDWRLLLPYVALYISSRHGSVIMPWRYYSVAAGITILALTIAQFLANALTHTRTKAPVGSAAA